MGMESFNIMLLSENVSIVKGKEYWSLGGKSHLLLEEIEEQLGKNGAMKSGNSEWILEDCLEIKEYTEGIFFQGMEVRGCLSCMQYGVNLCYHLLKVLCNEGIVLKVYIFNQEIQVEDAQQLYQTVKMMYRDKIQIFEKYYGKSEIKVTCSNFYHEVEKRNKWYYKLWHLR